MRQEKKLANRFPLSLGRTPLKLMARQPLVLPKKKARRGRPSKIDMFESLTVELQQHTYAVLETIGNELNEVIKNKELEIRFMWWDNIENMPDKMKFPFLYEIAKCIQFTQEKKVDFQLFVSFAVRIANKMKLSSPGKCLNAPETRSTFTRFLNKNCNKDEEAVQAVIEFYDYFLEKQRLVNGVILQQFVKLETKYNVKRCIPFEEIYETIEYCADEGIGFLWYIDFKVEKYKDAFDDPQKPFTLYLKNLTNNFFRPKKSDYAQFENARKSLDANPWKDVIEFLGLDPSVEFIDNSIPKGFEMSVEHIARNGKMDQIAKINKEGYYYTKAGDRFKGQRHHQVNGLHIIKCTPETFSEMRKSWWQLNLRKKPASLSELEEYGLYKDRLKPK